jgi:hypothetical protein
MNNFTLLYTGVSFKFGGKSFLFKILVIAILGCLFTVDLKAQISGTVFRDFNGNGVRENTTGTFVEPLAEGVIVTAYSASDVILASYTTTSDGAPNYVIPESGSDYNGIKGSNTGKVANGVAVRLEFFIPNGGSCLVNGVHDFPSKSGIVYGSSVRFIGAGSAARSGHNFALSNPADYVPGTEPRASTYIFQAVQFNGNPIGGGTAGGEKAVVKFPYNRSGGQPLSEGEKLATAAQVGSIYGVAYSKRAKKVFVSAFLKRHAGFGPADGIFNHTPGAIYMINPALHSTTGATSFFVSLDALGYPTHKYGGDAVAYGNGTSFSVTNNGLTGWGKAETVHYIGNGQGVIGTNVGRGLGADITSESTDAAAFGQVGKVGLGGIEMSEDGRFLFVVNLFDRKIYQLQLNSVTNPTSASYVTSWPLPTPPSRASSGLPGAATTYAESATINDFYNGVRGLQRPFGIKYRNGKLYVGSVTTGEGAGAINTKEDSKTGDCEYTDLWAYVWELTPSSGFSPSPVLQFPLNYHKGSNSDGFDESWTFWTETMGQARGEAYGGQFTKPQAMFSGIEFDVDGTMIIGIRDRTGDQGGYQNRMLSDVTTTRTAMAFGDLLRAYKNPNTCRFELEYAGKEGPNSPKPASSGAVNNQGPGGGEFYFQDGVENFSGVVTDGGYHLNTAMGGLAFLPGFEEVTVTVVDPQAAWSGGVSWMSSIDGWNNRDYELYRGFATGDLGKANGLGDVELLFDTAPIEIGNRVWLDTNGDGIQGADEPGVEGVLIELLSEGGDVLGTVSTTANGSWYFTTDSESATAGVAYVNLAPNTSYTVRLATTGAGNDWDASANSGAGGPRAGGDLAGLKLTLTDQVGNGEPDLSDNDASMAAGVPSISFTTGDYGENNHNLDFGFYSEGSLPVVLASFKAVASEEKTVDLQWVTTFETNVGYFEIQKSTTGKTWTPLGTVLAKQESNVRVTYSFIDGSPLNGQNIYRLKMVDRDGSFAYSGLESVIMKGLSMINIYPNPVVDKFQIATAKGVEVERVELYSGVGRMVMKVTQPDPKGVEVASLPAGTYVVKIVMTNGTIETRKLILR